MQPLAAPSPSPERAPGKEAGNAERAVNIVRTFPGLPEVAADLASQQPPTPPPAVGLRRISWPEDQSWHAFLTAHLGGGRKTRVDLINARAALAATRPPPALPKAPTQVEVDLKAKRVQKNLMARECAKRTRALIGEVNWKAKVAAYTKTYNRKRALDEAKRKEMLGTEPESVAQQPPQAPPPAPPAATEDAGRAGDDDDAGEDVFYWFYRQPRKRERPARKRGRSKGEGSAGASRHACAAPSFLQEPLPGIRQPPLPQPSFQPPPSLHPLPRSDLWTIVDMHGLG
jgi:hypothetical protein